MLNFSVQEFAEALGIFYYILVYGVGAIAMSLSISAYQFKHRITIILFNCFGQSCWVLHFLLQGDLTSAIACALSAVMLAIFSRKDKWKWSTSPVSIAIFIIIISGFSLISFKGWKDVFPLLAGVFAVLANSRSSEKHLRQLALFWCLFWLMNSIMKFYPIALANDLLCTISTIVALIRYRNKPEIQENDVKTEEKDTVNE